MRGEGHAGKTCLWEDIKVWPLLCSDRGCNCPFGGWGNGNKRLPLLDFHCVQTMRPFLYSESAERVIHGMLQKLSAFAIVKCALCSSLQFMYLGYMDLCNVRKKT